MRVERVGKTTHRVVHGKFYLVDQITGGKIRIIDEEGHPFQVSYCSDYWTVHVASKYEAGTINARYKVVESLAPPIPSAPPMPPSHEPVPMPPHLRSEVDTGREMHENYEQTLKTKEAPTMKIEKVILVAGNRADEISTETYMNLIRKEQQAIEALSDIPPSKRVAKIRKGHLMNIDNLVKLMDHYATDEV